MGHQKSGMAVCRLCSCADQIFDVFHTPVNNGQQLRYSILLTTGIHIKPTDVVSKMVCHRCCEIALKLHKYRNNAVANDKLLKERCGQPYSPPITNQQEVFGKASKIIAQARNACDETIIILDDDSDDDPLELLNLATGKKNVHEPSGVALNSQHSLDHTTHDATVNGRLSENRHSQNRALTTKKAASVPEELVVSKSVRVNGKIVGVKNSSVSAKPHKSIPKTRYKHPSVQKLFKRFEGIVLPEKIFKSDVSPVISLDSEEVNDWYKKHLKQKLPNVVIKKVPNSSNYTIFSSPEHSAVTSSKQVTATPSDTSIGTSAGQSEKITPSSQDTPKSNNRQIIDANNSDGDTVTREKMFNHDHQKENYVPHLTPRAPAADQHSIAVAKKNVALDISANQRITTSLTNVNSHKKTSRKKNIGRRSNMKRKRTLLDDSDSYEIIPEKRKRIYCNKNALKALNKMDLPQVCPADKNEQKAIFTSSLELRPVRPLPSSKSVFVEPVSLVEQTPVAQLPSLEPIGSPKFVVRTTQNIFLCPTCNGVYDTKVKLVDHESTHPKCTFCSKIVENVQLLNKHKENCFASIVNNMPFVKLRRVDGIPSLVKKYAEAFQDPNMNIQTDSGVNVYCDEYIDYYSDLSDSHIEEIVLPIPSDELFNGLEETDQNFGLVKQHQHDNQTIRAENRNSEVQYISDDSDEEIECKIIMRHKIIENPCFQTEVSSTTIDVDLTSDEPLSNSTASKLHQLKCVSNFPPLSDLSEKEMLRHVFKKYSYFPSKREKKSQTFTLSNVNIASPKRNLITIDHMFTELFTYKVPIHLEHGPKISATFKERLPITEQHLPVTMECWSHKKVVSVQKPRAKHNITTVLPNKTNITSGKLNSTTNSEKPAVIKMLTASEDCTSNITARVSSVKKSCNYASIVHAVTCALDTDIIQQMLDLVTEAPNKDVLSIQTGVSQNHTSIASEDRQECHNRSGVSNGRTSSFTTTSNSVIVSTTSLTLTNNVTSASSKIDALTCPVVNTYSSVNSTNQQQRPCITQSKSAITVLAQNNVSVTTTDHYPKINSSIPNMNTKINTAANSTMSVPSTMSVTSANSLCDVPSTSAITCIRYADQQRDTNFLHTEPSNSTVPPHQNTVISQNNAPVLLQSHQNYYTNSGRAANPVNVMPLTMPVGSANNLCNLAPIQARLSCSNPYQSHYTNFMRIVEPQNSTNVLHQAVPVTTANIAVSNRNCVRYTGPFTAANNGYGVTSTSAMVTLRNYANAVERRNSAAVSYQPTPANSNIISTSNARYETSFLYNTGLNISHQRANQISEVGTGNRPDPLLTETNPQPIPIHNGMIRVKTMQELS